MFCPGHFWVYSAFLQSFDGDYTWEVWEKTKLFIFSPTPPKKPVEAQTFPMGRGNNKGISDILFYIIAELPALLAWPLDVMVSSGSAKLSFSLHWTKNSLSCSENSNFLHFLKQLKKDNLPFWNEPSWGLGSGSPPNMILQESVALPAEQKEHKPVISLYITKCMKMLYTVKYLPSH